MPSGESHAIEPPPAPTVTTSIIGILEGNAPTEPSVVSVGSPSRTTETSVEVPPPSEVSTLSNPATLRDQRRAQRAGGRPGQHRGDRLVHDLVGGEHAAVRLHHVERHLAVPGVGAEAGL